MNILLRCETKKFEKRTPLIPDHARLLTNNGTKIYVERSDERIHTDEEYANAGCELIAPNSWIHADKNHYILGIKELPNLNQPLSGQHIYFAHAFKHQAGSETLLAQFKQGNGTILDYEFLIDSFNHSVVTSSFSYWAGFCGAAISLLAWDARLRNSNATIPLFYSDKAILIAELKDRISNWPSLPKSLIIGANGFSGRGARALLDKLHITHHHWARHHTHNEGPFPEILEYEILFNCINLTKKIKPFITRDLLKNNKNLGIITDVSCDVSSPHNPLPIYDSVTTFNNPLFHVDCESTIPVDVIAIDHLASFLPRESSESFSAQLLPYLLELLACGPNQEKSVWKNAIKKYHEAMTQ